MVTMCRASRRLISSTSAASVVVLPDPVGPPISTRPRGRCVSSSTLGGKSERRQARHARRQRAERRRGPAALAMQVDAEPPEPLHAERAVGDCDCRGRFAARAAPAPASTASSMSTPSSGPSAQRADPPSTRIDGGAPATSSRSLPPASASSPQPRLEPAGVTDRRGFRRPRSRREARRSAGRCPRNRVPCAHPTSTNWRWTPSKVYI